MKTIYFRVVLMVSCLIVLLLPKWVEDRLRLWIKPQAMALFLFLLGRKKARRLKLTTEQFEEMVELLELEVEEGKIRPNGAVSFTDNSIYGIIGAFDYTRYGGVITINDRYDWHEGKVMGYRGNTTQGKVLAIAKLLGFPITKGEEFLELEDKFFAKFGNGYVHQIRCADPLLFGTPAKAAAESGARAHQDAAEAARRPTVWEGYRSITNTSRPAYLRERVRRVRWVRKKRRNYGLLN